MATDLTIQVADERGQLARIGEALGAAGVNIEGFFGVTSEGRGEIHVTVDDAAAAKSALSDAGIDVAADHEVLVVGCADEPGALGQIARKVADAGANLQFAYLGTNTRLVLGADDLEKVRDAL